MDPPDGWNLRPVAEPVSYFDAATGQWTSGSFETAVKSEQRPAVVTSSDSTTAAASSAFAAAAQHGSASTPAHDPWNGSDVYCARRRAVHGQRGAEEAEARLGLPHGGHACADPVRLEGRERSPTSRVGRVFAPARPSTFAASLASLPFIGSDLDKRDKNRILT